MNILLIYGNGGGQARFTPLMEVTAIRNINMFTFFVPELAGHEGRPMPENDDIWGVLMEDIYRVIGVLWQFVVLEDADYALSRTYDANQMDDLLNIYSALCEAKKYIEQQLIIDN
jgi:hypothetical protein